MENISRRKFLIGAGTLVGAAAVPTALWKIFSDEDKIAIAKTTEPLGKGGADVKYLRQLIAADNASGRTIMWNSDKKMTAPVVQYRLAGTEKHQEIIASQEEFKTFDNGIININSASLENLKKGAVYEYRVGEKETFTDWCYMETAGKKEYKALIFPDSQCSKSYKTWADTVKAAWQNNLDAEFFVNMGDLVDNGQQYSQWKDWFDGAEGMMEKIPLAPVCGNHEDYSLDWKAAEPETFRKLFHAPPNGSGKYQNNFYSYDWGSVHFSVLDSNLHELGEFEPNLFKDQYEWLEKDLANTTAKWKVVMLHRHLFDYAILYAMQKTGLTDVGQFFMPLFDKYSVDLCLFAHIHTYHRTLPFKGGEVSDKGTVYISTGRSGDMTWYGYFPKRDGLDTEECDELKETNYIVLTAGDSFLQAECFVQSGKAVDKVRLEK